jgi:hypothetical protein
MLDEERHYLRVTMSRCLSQRNIVTGVYVSSMPEKKLDNCGMAIPRCLLQ